MGDVKKAGKALLRAVDSRKASGVCQYSVNAKGIEATISAQIFDSSAVPEAVFQYGADRDYLCRPSARLDAPIRADPGVAAVWVTDAGQPVLFAQIAPGAFDMIEARKRLAEGKKPHTESVKPQAQAVPAATPVPVPATAKTAAKATFREPKASDTAVPFPPPEPFFLLQPGAKRSPESTASEPPQPAMPTGQKTAKPPEAFAEPSLKIASFQPPALASSAEKKPFAQAAPPPPQPLVVKRAPRPTPRQPIYSPLWDDISAEFEKMLGNLPTAQPFNGNADGARFVEMPLAGAVQCYVGSVEIKGMKVFLQAVPARPFARPAGFDHSLVSRDGETFWVKYFIQE